MTACSRYPGRPGNRDDFSVADASTAHRRCLGDESYRGRKIKQRRRTIHRPMWGKNGVCCPEPISPISRLFLCQDKRSPIWCVVTLPKTTQLPETTHYRGPRLSEIQAKILESQYQAARLARSWH